MGNGGSSWRRSGVGEARRRSFLHLLGEGSEGGCGTATCSSQAHSRRPSQLSAPHPRLRLESGNPSLLSDSEFASISLFACSHFMFMFLYTIMLSCLHTLQAGTWEEKNLNKWASDRIKVAFFHYSQTSISLCFTSAMLSTHCVKLSDVHSS